MCVVVVLRVFGFLVFAVVVERGVRVVGGRRARLRGRGGGSLRLSAVL